MTKIERARRVYGLVDTMAKAFIELTDNYWHEQQNPPMDCQQLNIELGQAQRLAHAELKALEQEALTT